MHSASGFTLIELLVTLAVAAILVVAAVPSFKNLTLSNQLTTAANELVGSINTARMEAVRRNGSTQVCIDRSAANKNNSDKSGDDLGNACNATANQLNKLGAVYGQSATGVDLLHDGVSNIDNGLRIKGQMKAIRFTSDGIGHDVGDTAPFNGPVVDICTPGMSTDNHRIVKVTTGSIVSITKSSDPSCP